MDEAASRRFRKKLYIPLPDSQARETLLTNLLKKQAHTLSKDQIQTLTEATEGYSGSDLDGLCREAALGPIRSIQNIMAVNLGDVRGMEMRDFDHALRQVRKSVSEKDLEIHIVYDKEFGSSK